MNKLAFYIPLAAFMGLVALFAMMMGGDRNPQELKSVLIGKPAPTFSLPSLYDDTVRVTDKDLQMDGPVLVNFFASWCIPCRAEHDNLMTLAKENNIPIIGIAYKDAPEASRAFLEELGDPFTKHAVDQIGDVAIDWGVSGVPETFIIDKHGLIRYRHWGPIVGDGLDARVLPELEKAQ